MKKYADRRRLHGRCENAINFRIHNTRHRVMRKKSCHFRCVYTYNFKVEKFFKTVININNIIINPNDLLLAEIYLRIPLSQHKDSRRI
jgi:hypothetical protein